MGYCSRPRNFSGVLRLTWQSLPPGTPEYLSLRALLSEAPEARGTARQVAEALEA